MPRKKKVKPDYPATAIENPTAVGEAIDDFLNARKLKERIEPDAPRMEEPPPREIVHTEQHQGRILPRHVKIIHDGRNDDPPFEMGEDHAHRKMVFGFRQDPGERVKEVLERRRQYHPDRQPVNFTYDEQKKLWHAPSTPDGREAAYEAANEISGKDIRYGFGRGR